MSDKETIERLQAELDECKKERKQYMLEVFDKLADNIALAGRVKELEDVLRQAGAYIEEVNSRVMGEESKCYTLILINKALSSTDKTADEVINSWLGEPVGWVARGVHNTTSVHGEGILHLQHGR